MFWFFPAPVIRCVFDRDRVGLGTELEMFSTSQSSQTPWSPATRRETLLTLGIAPDSQIGLEIGAANNPIIPPVVGTCRYVDYMDRDALWARLADYPYRDQLVNVDYIWSGSGSLMDKVDGQTFDYAIASHVIEHVPNPVGWMSGICEVLKPGGHFNLAIPDRRFTFDVSCPESTVGQFVEAYLLKYERPSARQVFDSCFYGKAIDPGIRWSQHIDVDQVPAFTGDIAPQLSFDQAKKSLNGTYFDSHCWIFTPQSFLKNMEGICRLGIMPFEFADYHPTVDGEFEFFVSLRKPGSDLSGQALINQQMGQLAYFSRILDDRYRRLRMLTE